MPIAPSLALCERHRTQRWTTVYQSKTNAITLKRAQASSLTPEGLQETWLLVERAMNTDTIEWYIREQLAPHLHTGQIVVMDNLSAHTAARIREALVARGCDVLFLPPYSPDFNPIEQAFSKLKAILRGLGARTQDTLQAAVRLAVAAITSTDAATWYAHAGYPLPAQPL